LHTKPPTLVDYYKNFKEVSGVLAAAVSALPLLSAVLPATASAYMFPPLGGATMPARLGVVILAAVMTYIAFYSIKPANIARRFLLVALISFVALICYLFCYQHFVRRIDVPANNGEIFVSVGYKRSDFAERTFHSETDEEMLKARGISDEEVSRLWTPRSLDLARFLLLAAYCGFLLPVVSILSLGVRYQMP
jgi:hypothetical protein